MSANGEEWGVTHRACPKAIPEQEQKVHDPTDNHRPVIALPSHDDARATGVTWGNPCKIRLPGGKLPFAGGITEEAVDPLGDLRLEPA